MIDRIMNRAKRIFKYIMIDNNTYYKSRFKDCPKFWNHNQFNLKVVNLGSNSALYGFDYSRLNISGANWAMGPQSLNQDLAILKTYCSYIGPRGTILVPLCPYSSCLKNYTDTEMLKYYTIVHPGAIISTPQKVEAAFKLKNHPFQVARKQMIKGVLTSLRSYLSNKKDSIDLDYQPKTYSQLETDAQNFINGWLRQFKIDSMDSPCPPHILEGRKERVSTLTELLKFCQDRQLEYYIVLPPITKHLSSKFSEEFKKNYIYSFLEECGVESDRFLNYLEDASLQNDDLYFNSFFLNRKGAHLFTRRVLKDIGLLEN